MQSKVSPSHQPAAQPFPDLVQDSLIPIQDILGVMQSLPMGEPGQLGGLSPVQSIPSVPALATQSGVESSEQGQSWHWEIKLPGKAILGPETL